MIMPIIAATSLAAATCGPFAPPMALMTSATTSLVGTEDEPGEVYSVVYDLRGLNAMLDTGANEPEVVLNELMDRLSMAVDMSYDTMLFDTIFIVDGTEESHAAFRSYLDQIEALYSRRFEVDVVCFIAGSENAPGIGTQVTLSGLNILFRARQVAISGQPTRFASTTEFSFVQESVPVVGAHTLGYDPTIGTASDGVDLKVTVGPAPGGASGHEVQVRGAVREVRIEDGGTGQSKLDLPVRTERMVNSSIVLSKQRATVVAVVDGMATGETIVVSVAVRELE